MRSLRDFLPKKAAVVGPPPPPVPSSEAVAQSDVPSLPKAFGRKVTVAAPAPPVRKSESGKRDRNEFGERTSRSDVAVKKEPEEDKARERLERLYRVRDDVEDAKHRPAPWSEELSLASHTKMVSSLDFEPSGARMVSAGSDYMLKLWDFNGMDGSFQPFRTVEPREANAVRWCRYNKKGGRILVAPGGSQAKIFSRDGEEEVEFAKGDMYLAQMTATKGHCAVVTCCEWNPVNKKQLVTASLDSTMRVWDAEDKSRHQQIMHGPKGAGGKKIGYTCVQYAPDGGMLVGALADGTVQVWDARGSMKRAELTAINSDDGSECGSLAFDTTSRMMASRAGDEMRLWDTRLIKEPIHIWKGLATGPNSCLFSPDDTVMATAGIGNKLQLFSSSTFALVDERDMGEPFHQVVWHSKLNQIACGMRSGVVKILYSSDLSTKGALLCAARPMRKVEEEAEWNPGLGVIHNPDVEEEEAYKKRKSDVTERKKRQLTRPDLPVQGVGVGGQVGTSQQHQFLKKLLKLDEYVPEDPRQALLKYDAAAKADPKFISHAYQATQPEQVFASEKELSEYAELDKLRKQQAGSKKNTY